MYIPRSHLCHQRGASSVTVVYPGFPCRLSWRVEAHYRPSRASMSMPLMNQCDRVIFLWFCRQVSDDHVEVLDLFPAFYFCGTRCQQKLEAWNNCCFAKLVLLLLLLLLREPWAGGSAMLDIYMRTVFPLWANIT